MADTVKLCGDGGLINTLFEYAFAPLRWSPTKNSYSPTWVILGTSISTPVAPCEANCIAIGADAKAVASSAYCF